MNYSAFESSAGAFILSFNALNASRSPKVDFSTSWLILSMVLLLAAEAFFLAAGFSSSVEYIALCDKDILRSSLENSSTLKSSDSPTSILVPSSFTRFLLAQKPSIPYGSSSTAPLSFLLITVHLCTEPSVNTVSNVSQGFSSRCLWLRASLRFAASSSNTTTCILSPTFTNSEGCLIFLVQLR